MRSKDHNFDIEPTFTECKEKEKKSAIHLTGIEDIDKYNTFIAHQRFPSSLLFFPSFLSHTLKHCIRSNIAYAQPLKHFFSIPPLGRKNGCPPSFEKEG
jgi:hypothetical protein